jgi:septum formation protein
MLIIASQSPRRRELLAAAGFTFEVRLPEQPVEERLASGESAEAYVRRLSEAKARAVRASSEETVLGADTVVVVDGRVLEKPADAADAARMIGELAGRDHVVLTGVCLRRGDRVSIGVESTTVWFAPMSDDEIAAYASSGEPMDKAGAYGIQGRASKFIPRIEGCYFNVVGLPLALVYRMAREFGVPL